MQVPFAEALVVHSNGQIAAVGSSAEMLSLQQHATTVTDLQGAFVMPVCLPNATHNCWHQLDSVRLHAQHHPACLRDSPNPSLQLFCHTITSCVVL